MSSDTSDTRANGNTKIIRSRNWFFTWNNYDEYEKSEIWDFAKKNCKKYAINPEVGKNGTPHLQGCLIFENARTFESLKKKFEKVHWERVRNKEQAIEYCQKHETQNGECMTNIKKIKDPLENKELYTWQTEICELIDKEPDERKIYWYYDITGGAGKTSLAKHLCLKNKNQVLYICGKSSDIKYGVKQFVDNEDNDLKMCIFDFCRSNEHFVSYQGLEEIKNGIFYNTKYESGMVLFNTPHIIIFANFEPEMEKLSSDRWVIKNVGEELDIDIF